jgi:hypothetical protein
MFTRFTADSTHGGEPVSRWNRNEESTIFFRRYAH